MSQAEIYEYMRGLRKSGDNNYYTVKEIMKNMEGAGYTVNPKNFHTKVTRLWWIGFFEKYKSLKSGKESLYDRRLFRAKK